MLDKLLKKTGNQKSVNKRKGNLLEQHAEKIVFAVSGVLCLWLLVMFVIGSPNAVVIDGRKLKPGEVDKHIKTKADKLSADINVPPTTKPPLKDPTKIYIVKQTDPLGGVPDFQIKIPGKTDKVIKEDRLYALPVRGGIDKIAAEVIRGAAHIPVEEIGMDNPYDKAMTELGDIDLVTVEGSFDVAALYRSFKQSFSLGRGLKTEWRDPELASPVFASVQLHRRRLLEEGGWSDWEIIPRPKIDQYRAKIMGIPETVEELRFDIDMHKAQFKGLEFRQNILQPDPYDFASANAVWLSPTYRKEYIVLEERLKKEAIRTEREKLIERTRGRGGRTRNTAGAGEGYGYDADGGMEGRSGRRSSTRSGRGNPNIRGDRGGVDGGRGDYGAAGYYGGEAARRGPQERTLDDVIADNVKVLIDERTQFDAMREMLVFWAHDDTAMPGNTYQYKVRLGVFNPIAGNGWLTEQDKEFDNQVILWTDFSDVTESVEIHPMFHFFPTVIAKSQEKKVRIRVSKYHMGNWRSEDFDVCPGELIGKEVDFKRATRTRGAASLRGDFNEYDAGGYNPMNTMPEKINFGTGAMLVDIVKTDKWTGLSTLTRSQVADILYTTDGVTMMHLPVKRNNWPPAMKAQSMIIEEASKVDVELNSSRGQSSLKRRIRGGYMGGGRGEGRYDYGREYDEMDSRGSQYRRDR
jgi:hypothetical protein